MLSDLTGDSDPDDFSSEGVPSNRGASSGGTMSTTVASGSIDAVGSGGGGMSPFAATMSKPSTTIPRWPRTEIANPG